MTSSERRLFTAWVSERDMREARLLRAALEVTNAGLLLRAMAALRQELRGSSDVAHAHSEEVDDA